MENKTNSIQSRQLRSIAAKYKNKEWVKELESSSGVQIVLPQKSKNVLVLLDCSGSMGSNDKLGQAKRGSIGFSEDALSKGFSVGLIRFTSIAELLLKPSSKLSILKNLISELSVSGTTNLTDAIKTAREVLISIQGEKILCIVTDGMPDNEITAIEMAHQARQEGIDIMTIGTDDADITFLKKISTRDQLSIIVDSLQLEAGIRSMAKLLPCRKE